MTISRRAFLLPAAALLLAWPARVTAGPPEPAPVSIAASADPIFQRGALELQLVDGVEYSLQNTSARRPNIDYEVTALRLGYMLDSPNTGGTFLRGNDEVLLEAVGGPIFFGPGTALGGLSILYRRNFLAPDARWVPYINAGGGGVYSDAYHDRVQRALGSPFEFDLQGSVGLRFRLAAHVSLDGEVAYRHLSNADLAPRNYGTNGIGGVFGVSFTF